MMHKKAPAVIKQKTKQEKNSTDIIRQILHNIYCIKPNYSTR